jgi:hypothetical protein
MNSSLPPVPEKKGRGCFFYGCLTMAALFVVFCIVAFVAVRWIKKEIATYTDPAPIQLPVVEMSDKEFQALDQRVKAFSDAMSKALPGTTLTLTEREINALVARTPELKQAAGMVYIGFTNDQVRAQLSIPLQRIKPIAKGRFFNGEATFNLSLKNGVLIVTLDQASVKGVALPETFMKEARKENLAKDAYKKRENAEMLGKLESIEVVNDTIVIKGRAEK